MDDVEPDELTVPRYAARSLGRAIVDAVTPVVSLWLFWQLQDETSRLRVLLVDVYERAGELRGTLERAWRQRIVDDLAPTITNEGDTR